MCVGVPTDRCPRACGDFPDLFESFAALARLPPRLRGFSLTSYDRPTARNVAPAPAGIFRAAADHRRVERGRPRVGGDFPSTPAASAPDMWLPPHLRRCSGSVGGVPRLDRGRVVAVFVGVIAYGLLLFLVDEVFCVPSGAEVVGHSGLHGPFSA
ncbi:hypothetical protein STTU_p0078 (plasmid) [Streptomyces sp. Tu6071]|nr:hypothetical protein STTU_p0078 [Streptomyces sp. Tu6071]